LTGKLRFSAESPADLPCVGDWVFARYHNTGASAIIHGVLPRQTFLRRKCAGKNVDFQMIAANIDVAFIVQSCHYDFNLRRFDRYLVMANEGHIEPILVLTKTDLITDGEREDKLAAIRQSGITIRILALSSISGAGLAELRELLVPGKTCCLLGSSGVGKTTIINRLIGRDAFGTKAVSGTGEGVHTTTRRHLLVLEGGAMLIDTPGMRELGLIGTSEVMKDTFAEVGELALSCQFSDCTHGGEPGCAILQAVASGTLSEERCGSYLKLKKESEFHDLSYFKKRKKDKEFGRFIKAAKKSIKA